MDVVDNERDSPGLEIAYLACRKGRGFTGWNCIFVRIPLK